MVSVAGKAEATGDEKAKTTDKVATAVSLTLSLMIKLSPAANRCRPVVGAGLRERTGDLYLGGPISRPYLSRGGGDLLKGFSQTLR